MRIFFGLIALILIGSNIYAQKADPILFTVEDQDIGVSEF